jgi:hyperosmotically inducible protein
MKSSPPRAPFRVLLSATACLLALPGISATAAAEVRGDMRPDLGETRRDVKDGWIAGRLETLYALNRQLNSFDLDTRVEGGVVYLTGSVETAVERDLAGELARNVDGVTDVRNELKIASASSLPAARRAEREATARQRAELRRWVEDASTTAVVKSKLLANQNTRGLDINVETRNNVVTLRGQVASAEEKQLAELLARNTDEVAEVRNDLSINPAQSAARSP